MPEIKLEKEIKDASEKIELRQTDISESISGLESKIKQFSNWAWFFVWIGLAIFFLSPVYFFIKNDETGFALNMLGDFLGGSVASLWSLAGLFFIYVAFLGQKQQLLNQQLELLYSQLEVKYTRLELAGQKEELKKQNNTLQQQKFENTFFQLLGLFNNISNSIDINKGGIIYTGRDSFKIFYENLKAACRSEKQRLRTPGKISFEELMLGYGIFYEKNTSDLSHYFRTLYHIFKFVNQSEINNKERYTSLVRSQLSSYEQVLIFYNCLHQNGFKKFKPLIEKYHVFKNIDNNLLLNVNHKERYDISAFKKLKPTMSKIH